MTDAVEIPASFWQQIGCDEFAQIARAGGLSQEQWRRLQRHLARKGEEKVTDGPDPFESAVIGVIRILAPWPPEQRAKILQGADYCPLCGLERSKQSCQLARIDYADCAPIVMADAADFDAH